MSESIWIIGLLVISSAVFALLELLWGRRTPADADHVRTDVIYVASDLAFNLVAGVARLAVPVVLSILLGSGFHGPLREAPTWVQLAIGALILEFGIWLAHFIWHRFDVLYPFHAVHHASEHVYFLSGMRQHPVQFVGDQIFFALLLSLAGIGTASVVVLSGFQLVMTHFTHSNLDIHIGGLRYVFATPNFHVLHHDASGSGAMKNLGGGLSVFDWVFGTALDPDVVPTPETLGSGEPEIPRGYAGQLIYPFRKLTGSLR